MGVVAPVTPPRDWSALQGIRFKMAQGTPVRQQRVTEPRALAPSPVFTEVLTDGNAPLLLLSHLTGLSLEHGDHLAMSDWLAKDLGACDWLKHCTLAYGLRNKLRSAHDAAGFPRDLSHDSVAFHPLS